MDNRHVGVQLGTPDRHLPAVARRQPELQHLVHSLAREPKNPRRLPLTHLLNLHGAPHACVEFYHVHPPCDATSPVALHESGLVSDRPSATLTRDSLAYFCSAAYTCVFFWSFTFPG